MFDVSIYPDLIRIARTYTIGRNFDSEDLVHEMYLQDYSYTLSDKKLFLSLKKLAKTEIVNFVYNQIRQKLPEREHVCRQCQDQLPASAFYMIKDKKTNSTYLFSTCKECNKKSTAKYRHANKEEINKQAAAYRKENKEKVKAAQKAWYEANKGYAKQKRKEYREAHKK